MESNQVLPPEEAQTADQLIEQIVSGTFDTKSIRTQAEPTMRKFWQSPRVAYGGIALVFALTTWNVLRMTGTPDGFTAEQAGAYVNLVKATTAIERFADSVGRLPSSLSQVPVDQAGLSYVLNRDSYTLSTVVDGRSVTHRRGVPLFPLDRGYQSLDLKSRP